MILIIKNIDLPFKENPESIESILPLSINYNPVF